MPPVRSFAGMERVTLSENTLHDESDLNWDVREYIRSLPPEASILLTAEQEWSLSRTIQAGLAAEAQIKAAAKEPELVLFPEERARLERLVDEGKAAQTKFVLHNLRLVISIAKWYVGPEMPLMDLIQEGNLGLMKGVKNYDWRKGCRASTYLTWWIRQAISRGHIEQGPSIYLPHQVVEQVRVLTRARMKLRTDLGREPSLPELALACGKDVSWVQALDALPEVVLRFGEQMTGEDDHEEGILHSLAAPEHVENEVIARQRSRHLKAVLKRVLTEREYRFLVAAFGLFGVSQATYEQIHRAEGVSAERVRQIVNRAKQKLREAARTDSRIARHLDLALSK
jgi:RNA polymerase sigma factor (sigma-70 family)